jgi:hypothetical protein
MQEFYDWLTVQLELYLYNNQHDARVIFNLLRYHTSTGFGALGGGGGGGGGGWGGGGGGVGTGQVRLGWARLG